jgi:hypothetical protein
MTGSQLLSLQYPIDRFVRERRADLLSTMPVHNVQRIGAKPLRGIKYMLKNRLTRERLENLGQVGLHPLSLARREDDDGERHGGSRIEVTSDE